MTEILEAMTRPDVNGTPALPKRSGPKGLLPGTWVERTLKVAYTDCHGTGRETSGVLLDVYPFGPVLSLSGEKTARGKLDAIRAEAEGAHEKMLQALGEPLMENRTVEEQTLAELQEQRAWNRYKSALVSGKAPTEVVRQASERDGAPGIRALASELPSYLESGGWDKRHVAAIEEQIRTAEEPFLSREERSVRESAAEAKEGWGRLSAAFAHADMDLEGPSPGALATQLPAWEGGHIPVSDAAAD